MTSESHLMADVSSAPPVDRQASLAVGPELAPSIATREPPPAVHERRSRIALFGEAAAEGLTIAGVLLPDGHIVCREESAEAFVEMTRRERFDLLVISWGPQSMQGMEVLRNVRLLPSASSSARILVLTMRNSEFEVVQALESGADDCTSPSGRPFELFARVKVLLRATRDPDARPSHGFTFNQGALTAQRNGIEVKLAPREFELAQLLFRNFERTVTRAHLLAELWGSGDKGTSRTVDQHVVRIRRKLQLFPEKGFALQAIYKVGYVVRSATKVQTHECQ